MFLAAGANRTLRPWRGACATTLLLLFVAPFVPALRGDEFSQVDRYLEKLGLADLRLLHRQQQLASQESSPDRNSRAKQLSDLYAQRLLETADDPPRFEEIAAHVQKLLRDFPAADSPQLQILLLQAEYQRAEAKALRWIDDPANDDAKAEALQAFNMLLPTFTNRRQELAKQLDALQEQSDAAEEAVLEGKDRKRTKPLNTVDPQQEMLRLQATLGRAQFFEGWASFFQGLLSKSSEAANDSYKHSEESFSQLLEVGAEGDTLELDADALGLESVWRCRALMGLGAALAAQHRLHAAEACFAALTHSAVPPTIRDSALYWHVLALVGSQQWKEVRDLLEPQLANFSAERAASRTPCCILLVRTAWARPKASAVPVEAAELAALGLEGLARLKQFDALAALVAKYRPQPTAADGFYALWTKGKLEFAAAEKSKAAADYQSAATWLQSALKLPEAKDNLSAAANCRYTLAWCDYRCDRFTEALPAFEQSATELKALGDDSAVQAAWMAFTCNQQLHAQTKLPKFQAAAIASLTTLRRDYPQTEQAQKAELLLARLQSNTASRESSLKSLEAVPVESPNYVSARYELCLARHQAWSKAAAKSPEREKLATALINDVSTYLSVAPSTELNSRLRTSLLAIDACLAKSPPAWDLAAPFYSAADAATAKLADSDSMAPQYHYRLLQRAEHQRSTADMNRQAEWLSSHAAGSPYELPGLVIVARSADAALAAAKSPVEKSERRAAAIAIYQRLVKLLGESTSVMANKKNALVANSRLAMYELESGQAAEAARRFDRIVAATPADRTIVRRAGAAWFQAGDFAKALPHYSTLAAGITSGSEEWYDAKYHQLLCLVKTSPDEARAAWRQFQVLHPDVQSEVWKGRFAELAKSFPAQP